MTVTTRIKWQLILSCGRHVGAELIVVVFKFICALGGILSISVMCIGRHSQRRPLKKKMCGFSWLL